MAAIIWNDVTSYPGASGLSTVSVPAQTAILAYVNGVLDVSLFPDAEDGATTKLLRILMAAHMASAGAVAGHGAAGPVVSESVGGIARSYANLATAASLLSSTVYGQSFDMILNGTAARVGFAT